jgi:hypothetical protein
VKECFSGESTIAEELLEPHENLIFHTRMKLLLIQFSLYLLEEKGKIRLHLGILILEASVNTGLIFCVEQFGRYQMMLVSKAFLGMDCNNVTHFLDNSKYSSKRQVALFSAVSHYSHHIQRVF